MDRRAENHLTGNTVAHPALRATFSPLRGEKEGLIDVLSETQRYVLLAFGPNSEWEPKVSPYEGLQHMPYGHQ
jgi:hypothetical protein